ncbi:A-kinase anchor protein 7 isoform X2 [Archocentrus centrarchus]|nr:A-kinase anchoring protein 7 isoform X2 [Archocentrus centrarchus]
MQPASISYGRDATADDGDEEEEGDGGDENLAGQEIGAEHKEPRETVLTSGQADAIGMQVQESPADTEASSVSTPSGSNEKITRRKKRRERRKLMKKKLKSSDTSDSLLSELPFALTSPTTWKALFPNLESAEKKRKRKRGDGEGRVDSEEDKKKKKRESQRPNYFVSIPITNTQISSAVSEVQEAVLQREPRLAKAMIPVPTLHITLLVTHLANQEQVDLAAAVLAQVEPSLAELLGGRDLVLPFSGISHFRKEVVFVGLASGQHRHTLDSLAELLRSRFEEHGLLQGEGRGFEPHLTIMKLSRASKLRSQGIKRVDPALYSNYTDKFFGDQTVERVDLCSMLKKKQQDGYYHTETSLQLGGRRRSEPDEAELLRVSKRLVEDAVNRALQQYKQETLQNGGGPNAAAVKPPGNTEETATKTNTTANSTTVNRK